MKIEDFMKQHGIEWISTFDAVVHGPLWSEDGCECCSPGTPGEVFEVDGHKSNEKYNGETVLDVWHGHLCDCCIDAAFDYVSDRNSKREIPENIKRVFTAVQLDDTRKNEDARHLVKGWLSFINELRKAEEEKL